MYFHRLSIIIPLCFLLLRQFILSVALNSPALYYPLDDIAVNCGSSGHSTAVDGRQWIGDIGSEYFIPQGSKGKLMSSTAIEDQPIAPPDPVPYKTAQISRGQFTYTFQVTPGQKFVRLHFYPTSYPGGFERSKAFFTVKAGPYILLSNFSASLAADALGLQSFAKEFCVNVEENQPLTITFSPSPGGSLGEEVYAFVNGIEIVSLPTGLYHTPKGDPGARVIGKNYRFPIDKSIALETVQRLNVGGSSILSVEDTGMFREWFEDSNYLLEESSVSPFTMTVRIKYTSIPTYTAPQKVYQTSWSMIPHKQANKPSNFTWKLPVDLGFRYLVRFHFCELECDMECNIFINNQMAEVDSDLIRWSGGNRVAVYRDYVVMMEGDRMEGKRDLLIALCPHESQEDYEHMTDAILKGLEVFKLSNPDNNLAAGVNPRVSLPHASTSSSNANAWRKLVFASGGIAIATGVIVISITTAVSMVVYKWQILGKKLRKENHSSLPPHEENNLSSLTEGLFRRFSLAEVRLMTNNFDEGLVLGKGGFGTVYKGLILGGATTVAVKRRNSVSKQGADEFWAEIKTLPKLWHKNLVNLMGYCYERDEMILLYEYMHNGNLTGHLYNISSCNLSWEQRLNICIGAARGLDYLHTGTPQLVIHGDVKSMNILLDKDWVAQISDFGLSKVGDSQSQSYFSTVVKGTFGYLDPEYFRTSRLTEKSDVYSFGAVLLEVLCGRRVVNFCLEEEQRNLVLWAQRCIKEGKVDQIIDPRLRGKISSNCLKVFVEVANKCLRLRPNRRPSMADVVVSLKRALASQKHQCSDFSREEEKDVVRDGGTDDEQTDENILPEEKDVVHDGSTDDEQTDENILPDDILSTIPLSFTSELYGENIQTDVALSDGGVQDKRIDENIQPDDTLPQGSVPVLFSTEVQQLDEIIVPQGKKRSKVNLNKVFQESFTIFTKGMGLRWRKRKNYDSNAERLQWDSATQLCRRFSIAEIRAATNNFHDDLLIGAGGFSKVYRGWIDHGALEIAIRRLKAQASAESYMLRDGIQAQSQLSHPNILSLIGYCDDEGELMLVYNYMVNRSLQNHLYGMDGGYDPLPWKKRLEICIGAARGLQYLHSGTMPAIVHRNIKPTKILLDENWVPKVSDFELSKVVAIGITAVTSRFCGTMGYLDPEYIHQLVLTEKSDVYSFAVVLLEVLCARKAYDSSLNEDQMLLVRWFRTNIRRQTIEKIIDPYLVGRIAPECLKEVVKIARNCLLERGRERPSMDDVVGSLQIALQLQQTWHSEIESASLNHPVEESFHTDVARAYNNVLLYDSGFDISHTRN